MQKLISAMMRRHPFNSEFEKEARQKQLFSQRGIAFCQPVEKPFQSVFVFAFSSSLQERHEQDDSDSAGQERVIRA